MSLSYSLKRATRRLQAARERTFRAASSKRIAIARAILMKTVRNADRILVVDQGRIVQQGTHESLMKEDGIYRRLVSERSEAAYWKIA